MELQATRPVSYNTAEIKCENRNGESGTTIEIQKRKEVAAEY